MNSIFIILNLQNSFIFISMISLLSQPFFILHPLKKSTLKSIFMVWELWKCECPYLNSLSFILFGKKKMLNIYILYPWWLSICFSYFKILISNKTVINSPKFFNFLTHKSNFVSKIFLIPWKSLSKYTSQEFLKIPLHFIYPFISSSSSVICLWLIL